MKVSLITTTYNTPTALGKAIDSVLLQTRLPDEIIIADDGSGEETARAVERYSGITPFPIRHVWQEHKGFRAARIRNKAIAGSSGEYIILLDGDCVLNRYFIEDHLTLAEEGCFIQGKRVHISRRAVESFDHASANSTATLFSMALTGRISNIHHLVRFPRFPVIKNRKLIGIKSCNMSFFRHDIVAVNGFNEDYVGWGNEDSDLACRFFKYGLLKKIHPFMAICFHLWHPTNKIVPDKNEKLLAAAVASGEYYCGHGLVKGK